MNDFVLSKKGKYENCIFLKCFYFHRYYEFEIQNWPKLDGTILWFK